MKFRHLRIVRKPVRKNSSFIKRGSFHEDFCKFMPVKVSKGIPRQAEVTLGGSGYVKAPDLLDFRHYKGGRSSAKRTGRLYPRKKSLVLIFRG